MVEAAFVDSRRFARVRLLACDADDIRNVTPLMENGPDPVVDKDLVTVEWLTELCRRKKIPIKALLLDQANISGIGNWVGDEIMYHAKMHPEQYSNTLSDVQIKELHKSTHYVCSTAVNLLADSEKFPSNWLFKHRWGKGKKDSPKQLPNGEKITFLTVGGRTSAIVPSAQSKTGPVTKDISEAADGVEEIDGPSKMSGAKTSKKRKNMAGSQLPDIDDGAKDDTPAKRRRKSKFKEELSEEDQPLGMESNGERQTSEIGKQKEVGGKGRKRQKKVTGTTAKAPCAP